MERSKSKFCKNIKLSWGAFEFKLLGIQFTINLEHIVSKNYEPILRKVTNTIKTWNIRILKLVRKIAVIKSLLMSNVVHLFQTLPMPPPNLV